MKRRKTFGREAFGRVSRFLRGRGGSVFLGGEAAQRAFLSPREVAVRRLVFWCERWRKRSPEEAWRGLACSGRACWARAFVAKKSGRGASLGLSWRARRAFSGWWNCRFRRVSAGCSSVGFVRFFGLSLRAALAPTVKTPVMDSSNKEVF
jgi:hypothetical protein